MPGSWPRSPPTVDQNSSVRGGHHAEEATLKHRDGKAAWKCHAQLLRFREAAKDIADSFLKEQKIKLRASRKRKAPQQDRKADEDGARNSKQINVREKSLEDRRVDLLVGVETES